jgi:hypothetical protein
LDIAGTTIEIPNPKYLSNSMLITRQDFEDQSEGLKRTPDEKINNMMEFTHNDIDSWLVEYTNKNEYIENILQNLSIDLREIENELFNININQEEVMADNPTESNKNIKEETTRR